MTQDNTKYGDRIPDDHWEEDNEQDGGPDRTRVKSHEVDVYHDDETNPEDNYSRSRYTVTIKYDNDTGDPYVLYVVKHRWKGNYWRDTTDLDWRDTPEPVREQVAAALPVDGPDELDSGTRLIEEGGESRWQKIHKPRVESYDSGGEMWAENYLKGAVEQLDGAAESLDDNETQERLTELVGEIQDLTEDIRGEGQ